MTARVRALQLTAVALLATMAVGSLLMIVAGASPLHAWAQLLGKTLGERQGFGQVLADFDAVMNHGAAPGERAAAWAGLGVPGPFSNGYARRAPGMAWSETAA